MNGIVTTAQLCEHLNDAQIAELTDPAKGNWGVVFFPESMNGPVRVDRVLGGYVVRYGTTVDELRKLARA